MKLTYRLPAQPTIKAQRFLNIIAQQDFLADLRIPIRHRFQQQRTPALILYGGIDNQILDIEDRFSIANRTDKA